MTRFYKQVLYVVSITCVLVAMITIKVVIQKRTLASLVARARYAVKRISDKTSQTNQIPPSVALELSDEIREHSAIRIIGKKSVDYGGIILLDEDRKAMTRVGVLEYPLFQFDDIQRESRTQIEIQYDLVGALRFKLHGYNPSLQTK